MAINYSFIGTFCIHVCGARSRMAIDYSFIGTLLHSCVWRLFENGDRLHGFFL